MNAAQMMTWMSGLTLIDALWWFIENVNDETPGRTEVFFYLRERVRKGV